MAVLVLIELTHVLPVGLLQHRNILCGSLAEYISQGRL